MTSARSFLLMTVFLMDPISAKFSCIHFFCVLTIYDREAILSNFYNCSVFVLLPINTGGLSLLMGFDMEVFQKLLVDNDEKNQTKLILISVEEFEHLIKRKLLPPVETITIQPVLQVWGELVDGRNKLSGFVIIKGVPNYIFVVIGYDAEVPESINLVHEQAYFSDILRESLVDSIVGMKFATSIITLDILVQVS